MLSREIQLNALTCGKYNIRRMRRDANNMLHHRICFEISETALSQHRKNRITK